MPPPTIPKLPPLTAATKQRLMMGGLAVVFFVVMIGVYNRKKASDEALLAARAKKLAEYYKEPIEIVAASADIPEGAVITQDLLTFIKVPERFAQPYSVQNPNQLIGLAAAAPIAAGEQVLTNKLKTPQEFHQGVTLSSVVPPGKRAVTINVNTLTGVGGFVRPGDLVDVLWTLGVPSGDPKNPELITVTLFQDVAVVATNRQVFGTLPEEQVAAEGEEGAPRSARGSEEGEYTVTLALSPQEISMLLFAREQGRVQLALRSTDEEGTQVAVTPVNMTTVLSATLGADVLQASQPKPPKQVELFKGLNRDVVVLPNDGSGDP